MGGVWYDVNGWLTWALGSLDGTVPGARRYAWSEYTRNTLAAHANAFPRHWDGTVSVDDACNAFYASRPANCGVGLYSDYAGQITEQPTWMVMDAVNLAGVTATQSGFRIIPHLGRFSLRLPRVGVERTEAASGATCGSPRTLGSRSASAACPAAQRSGPGRTAIPFPIALAAAWCASAFRRGRAGRRIGRSPGSR